MEHTTTPGTGEQPMVEIKKQKQQTFHQPYELFFK